MLLIQNIVVATFLLLLAVYFAGIYYYPPHRDYGGSGNLTDPGDDWTGSGLGFNMLLLLCLYKLNSTRVNAIDLELAAKRAAEEKIDAQNAI